MTALDLVLAKASVTGLATELAKVSESEKASATELAKVSAIERATVTGLGRVPETATGKALALCLSHQA